MDQYSAASPSRDIANNPSDNGTQHHGRPYSDSKSVSTSTYDFSTTGKSLGDHDPSYGTGATNRAYPPPHRASFNSVAIPHRRVVTEKNRWTALTLRGWVAITMIALMLAVAVAIEVAYFFSYKLNGYNVDLLAKYGSPQFFGSFLPVLAILPLVLYCLTVTHEVHRLQPFISASHGNAPPQQTVLVSYINQNTFLAALSALRNGHRMVVAVTMLAYLTSLWQPLSAALFVVRSTNHILDDFSPIVVNAELGVNPSFTDLDAFLAAAGYAEAAVVHGLGDPPFVRGGWTVAPFDFPSQPKNATMALDVQAVLVDPRCETLSPQLNKITDGSYNVTSIRGNCVYSFRANLTDGDDAFGVTKVDNCSDQSANVEDIFKPVVFWFFTFDGPTASMIHCQPSVETHLVRANVSLSTQLIISEPTKLEERTSNVTVGAPFNGFALNGVFFPQPPSDRFVEARGIAVRGAIPNAIHKDAASNPRGMASSLRDITGQLDRVNKIYTQYLTIAAKSNFFIPKASAVKPEVHTWMPRLWIDPFACHVLVALILFTAISMSIIQYLHRRDRSQLFLAGPTGSIASDVSLTSSAKFGLLLNAGDTEEDLERKLHGMRFGIERATGQIIVESEKVNHIPKYIKEDMLGAKLDPRYPEDVQASLLANEAGPGVVNHDSFIGLRTHDRESIQSAVGSTAPLLTSPPPNASFSQTRSSTYSSPSRSTVVLSPAPMGPTTFTSPPPSSIEARFPSTNFSAPAGPPPQLQNRNSYHDPYAPNPT